MDIFFPVFAERAEENHENDEPEWSMSRPRFEPKAS
jgi:hypothetical protein